ncbi:hypothetical protein B0T10DRAFT_575324 [Thelonectria olida]|uniref:Uncharacterized protein n=1 Tax=Thelonectria olida TaxID=1576542 RepID=A0A9P9AQY8_9HYPO|nr:hypothetical protein B0T10DRAFT_575324 [Thelonectria olida]
MGVTSVIGDATISVPDFTTSTNLGPLTTTASFPDDCLSKLYDMNTGGLGMPWTYQTQGCAISTCCPSENSYTEPYEWMTSYYSPGVCPSQYRACDPPSSPTELDSASGETIAFCCPKSYRCPGANPDGIFWACMSLLSTSTEVVVMDDITNQETLSTRKFTLSPGMSNSWQVAYPIQIRWRAVDFQADTSTTAASETGIATSLTTIPATATGDTDSSQTSSHSSSDNGSHLSTGAIVGIAVGSFFFALLLAGVLACILLRRKRDLRNLDSTAHTVQPEYAGGKQT